MLREIFQYSQPIWLPCRYNAPYFNKPIQPLCLQQHELSLNFAPMVYIKLQRMLDRWQTLPPNERPIDQHPIKRPPLPPASRRTEPPSSSSPQEPVSVGPKGGTTGELLQEEATCNTTGEHIPEDRRARWISAMQGLLQHLPQWLQQDDNYNRRDALSIMSDLPSSWPSCRLCINADVFFDLQARATSEIAVADLNDSENR